MNAYSTLWTSISFSVPQDTKAAKAAARKFIRTVKNLGMGGNHSLVIFRGRGAGLICCRYAKVVETLSAVLPEDGELRLVPVTDKQVEKSTIVWGKMRKFATTGGVATN